MASQAKIALVGDYDPSVTAHVAIPKALEMAPGDLTWDWVGTESIRSGTNVAGYDAVWCVPASPYANEAGAIMAIRHARESGKPFLGSCGGYQHAVLEFARNVLGHSKAGNTEVDPDCPMPVIGTLTCALIDVEGDIHFAPEGQMAAIHGTDRVREGYRCSYGVNAQYLPLFEDGPLTFTGFDGEGDPRAFELKGHPFFVGTAYQPERTALKGIAHPIITAFTQAAAARVAQAA